MKKLLMVAAILAASVPICAQTVTVKASYLYDGLNPAYGTLTLAPVTPTGQPASYHRPGGGQASITPLTVGVQNGAFTLAGVPDTALASPANICFELILSTQNGSQVLGPGYGCLQPSATGQSSWCSTTGGVTTCNLDNYLPNIAPLALNGFVQSINGFPGAWTMGTGFTCNTATLTCTATGGGSNIWDLYT